jgi:hypothetical protein
MCMFSITTTLILIRHSMCSSLVNIISFNYCDYGSLQFGKKRMANKEEDECILWCSIIESSYVLVTTTTSQSSCNSEVKSPLWWLSHRFFSHIFSTLVLRMISHSHFQFPFNMLCNEILINILLCLPSTSISLFNWKGQHHFLFS